MKPSPHDHPDLTAYVLGELNNVESARVRQLLAQSPEARAEHERLCQMVNALREQAPTIPQLRLNPRQRETVLAMGQPRASLHPGRDRARHIAWNVAKLAAAACVTAGAFAAGMKYADRLEEITRISAAHPPMPVQKSPATVVSPAPANAAQVAVVEKNSAPAPVVQSVATATAHADGVVLTTGIAPNSPVLAAAAPAPASAPAHAPLPDVKPEPAPVIAQVAPASKPAPANPLKAFALVKTQPESTFVLQPKLLRPKIRPTEFAGITLAAPVLEHPKNNTPKNQGPHKPEPQPALVIHYSKAEIASCPWDSSRRLMRLWARIPVDQAAVDMNDQDYHLAVKFDPAQVQGYRLVMEKHVPASNAGALADCFAWYEIIPAKNFSGSHDKPATLGVMEIVQPKGAVLPVSSPPLALVDHGSDWNEKGEAFVFETAMVGFKLLLQGSENVGSLNHRMVLDLAQQSRGDDSNGERTKFIHAVQQAQKAAGL